MTDGSGAAVGGMVGRDAELQVLRDAFTAGRSGTLRAVVVRGEAGIGKTRLLREFVAEATLATLVPLSEGEHSDAPPSEYLAETVEAILERLSDDHHLVLIIEDLHWADAATLALLGTLISTLRGRYLTMIATYRSDDIDRFHPLRPMLAEFERSRSVIDLEITRLSAAQVADLPDTLRGLVLARYERLSPSTQRLIRTLAAGGVHVDHDLLDDVATIDEDELDDALREAIDARVIVAEGSGYTFRHALTQEAVHGELLPSERVRAHARYAEQLSRQPPAPGIASAIAEHRIAARDIPGAFEATASALVESRAVFAPAASARLAERLVELWDQVPDAAQVAGRSLPKLYVELANDLRDLGENERGVRVTEEGIAACGPGDDLQRAALLRLRFVHEFNRTGRAEEPYLEEAARLLEGRTDRESLALLARAYAVHSPGSSDDESTQKRARAIELAEQSGDDEALSIALTSMAWQVSDAEDDEPQALTFAERAMTESANPSRLAFSAVTLTDVLTRLGRFGDAIKVGEELRAVDGLPVRGAGAWVAANRVEALYAKIGAANRAEAAALFTAELT